MDSAHLPLFSECDGDVLMGVCPATASVATLRPPIPPRPSPMHDGRVWLLLGGFSRP